jgi:glycosyltransferase involved in cell wall biosynthesis
VSALHALWHRPDVALVFNAANAPFVALLRLAGVPVALHVDGHDARRAKWRGLGALYYRLATRWGSAVARAVVVDSEAVREELAREEGVRSDYYIAYGAGRPQTGTAHADELLTHYGVTPGGYHLVVARFEPENNVLEILQGYAASSSHLPLVVVGFAGYPGDYARSIVEAAAMHPEIHLVGAVWDQQLLDGLYAHARTYVHGHSVGGTNPSLLRAMAQSTPVIAYDCPYNRETTGGAALWFSSEDDLSDMLKVAETEPEVPARLGEQAGERAHEHYRWSAVADAYEQLARDLTAR